MTVKRWQDYDCPVTGIDFDLGTESWAPMVYEGDDFHCSGCGGTHVATAELVQQYEEDESGEVRGVALQRREVTQNSRSARDKK